MVKWPPSRLISWAASLGPTVGLLVEKVLGSVKHPEQRYRSAMGIIRLGKKYGNARLEKASGRAMELGAYSYRFVADMLKNNMDQSHRYRRRKQLTLERNRGEHARARLLPLNKSYHRKKILIIEQTIDKLYQMKLFGMAESGEDAHFPR